MSSINAVILAVASKAQQKKQKTDAKVAVEATLEADRKAKCLLFEKEHRINTKYDWVTPPTKPLRNNGNRGGAKPMMSQQSTPHQSSLNPAYAAADEVWFKPRLCYIRDAVVVHDGNDDCMAYDNATRIVKRKDYRVC